MATAKITVDEGTTTNLATYTISEDAVTKHINRSILSNNAGADTGVAALPLQVSLANTAANGTAVKVDGSAVTQPVSAASLPLPSGASTSAKQPALGTAGSASADVITIQGVASMTAVKVDNSAVTQPVSGTVAVSSITTSITPGTGATNLGKAEDAASADADVGVGMLAVRKATPANTSGTDGDYEFLQMSAGRLWVDASGKTLTVDGSGVTQPVSGTVSVTANSSVNVNQLAGTTTDTNSGNKSAGTLRVVLATDQPALTNKLLVTPDSVALPANQSVNINQINGVTPLMGAGNTGTGSPRVTIATDQAAIPASQSGTWTVQPGNTANTTAWLVNAGDGKTHKVKTGSASATFTIIAAVASKKLKVYSLSLMTASTTAVTVTFKDAAAGTAIGTYILQAITGTNFGIAENTVIPCSLFETTAGNLLEMSFSGAVSVTYNLRYWDDDAT